MEEGRALEPGGLPFRRQLFRVVDFKMEVASEQVVVSEEVFRDKATLASSCRGWPTTTFFAVLGSVV